MLRDHLALGLFLGDRKVQLHHSREQIQAKKRPDKNKEKKIKSKVVHPVVDGGPRPPLAIVLRILHIRQVI